MGSDKKDKEYTVGYEYYWGQHIVPCAAPIDGIARIEFDDRLAWKGTAGSGGIEVSALSLFGGKEREGGVGGHISILDGRPGGQPNDYLKQTLDLGEYSGGNAGTYVGENPALVSGYKGVFSLAFRRFYWGNLPRQKKFSILLRNVFSTYPDTYSGASPELQQPGTWLPEFAPTCPEFDADEFNLHIAMDNSGSMAGDRDVNLRAALKNLMEFLGEQADTGRNFSVQIQPFNINADVTPYQSIPFTQADVAGAKAYIDAVGDPLLFTYFHEGVESAPQFYEDAESTLIGNEEFNSYESAAFGDTGKVDANELIGSMRRVMLFITDGVANPTESGDQAKAILDGIDGLESWGALIGDTNPDLESDINKVSTMGWFQVDSQGSNLSPFLTQPFMSFADLNAAHILRHILVSPQCGGEGDTTIIGDSFASAAELFYLEEMGFSFYWDRKRVTRDEFRKMVEAHCGARTYISPDTGKWEIKPIRPDYLVENLTTINKSVIVEWLDHKLPRQWELPNQITIVGHKRENGEPQSVTRTNAAAVASMTSPTIRNQEIQFEGLSCLETFERIVDRELLSRTQPIRVGAVRLAYYPTHPDGSSMNEGDAFILDDPRLDIVAEVCRVEEIEDTDGKDNSVILRFSQDVWKADPQSLTIGTDDTATTGVQDFTPQPCPIHFTEEASYYDLIFTKGQNDTTLALAADPEAGYWQMGGSYPNNAHISAKIARFKSDSQWVSAGSTTLMPVWEVLSAVTKSASDTVIVTATNGRESEMIVGQFVQIDDERLRVDSIVVSQAAGTATWVVGRGCLDTVPLPHLVGSYLLGWGGATGTDGLEYTLGESVLLRLLTTTGRGTLNINDAPTQTVTMANRAIRPYPVGRLQVDGDYIPTVQKSGNITVTWAHRDRIAQTSEAVEDHTDADIGPEAGVSYHLVRRWITLDSGGLEVVAFEQEDALSPGDQNSYVLDLADSAFLAYEPAGSIGIDVGIRTKRATYENWQTPFVRVVPISPPFNLQGVLL